MSERNCMKCRVCYFKEDLCEESFCKKYWGEGDSEDFINAVKQPEWIPCSERLPEEDTYVLATTAWGEITMAEKLSDIAWFIYEGSANAKSDDIVAWMPLPEPYRGDEE